MISFRKILFKSALAFCLAYPVSLSASFIPLTEGDKETLTTTYEIPFEIVTTIEARKLQQLPEGLRSNALISDYVELGKEEKGVILSFEPYGVAPQVIIPENFPLNMYELLIQHLTGQTINLDRSEDFGRLESKAVVGSGFEVESQFEVGSRIEQYPFPPAYFLERFDIRRKILSEISLARICQNNGDLMNTARFIFEEHNKHLSEISLSRIKALSELLAYALGIEVLNNPKIGVSLQIDDHKIPVKGKTNLNTYRKKLKKQMQGILSDLNLNYDPERNALIRLKK